MYDESAKVYRRREKKLNGLILREWENVIIVKTVRISVRTCSREKNWE